MKPTGNELSVYFHRSRIGFILAGLAFTALLISAIYLTWFSGILPGNHRYDGPAAFYLTKFIGIPVIGIVCFYCFRTAFTANSKVIELRVGPTGVWRRSPTGGEIYISWDEIDSIAIETTAAAEKLLRFSLKDSSKFPQFTLIDGVYLMASGSPIPLEELSEKFCRFPEYNQRWRPVT